MGGENRIWRLVGVGLLWAMGSGLAAAAMSVQQKLSYSMGFEVGSQVGQTLRAQQQKVDPAIFAEGVRDAVSGHKPVLAPTEMEGLLKRRAESQLTKLRKLAAANQQETDRFLAENGKKKGVVTLPSGLQYQVLKAGTGARPTLDDAAVVDYTAMLPNGTKFSDGKDAVMPIKGLVPGLRQALLLMPQGSHWKVVIPPTLGFGPNGPPPVGPNRTMVFDLTLTGVKTASDAGQATP